MDLVCSKCGRIMELIIDLGEKVIAECPVCAVRETILKVSKEVAADAEAGVVTEAVKVAVDVKGAVEAEIQKLEQEVVDFQKSISQ